MAVARAEGADLPDLARLLWLHAGPEEQARQSVVSFAEDLASWWTDHRDSHFAFIARQAESGVVGMTWLALVPRVPRPGTATRLSADVQSVYVVPEQRGSGLGSSLIRAATDFAIHRGAARVTVHSGRRAVPVYERLGFVSSRELLQKSAG